LHLPIGSGANLNPRHSNFPIAEFGIRALSLT
jgi:hypothetical protein